MIRIQDLARMKKGERDLDNVVLSLRLRGAEAARFWRVMDLAKSRNAYIDRSDVLRELLRLNPTEVLTEDDIKFFCTGEKTETRRSSVPTTQIQLEAPKKSKQSKAG